MATASASPATSARPPRSVCVRARLAGGARPSRALTAALVPGHGRATRAAGRQCARARATPRRCARAARRVAAAPLATSATAPRARALVRVLCVPADGGGPDGDARRRARLGACQRARPRSRPSTSRRRTPCARALRRRRRPRARPAPTWASAAQWPRAGRRRRASSPPTAPAATSRSSTWPSPTRPSRATRCSSSSSCPACAHGAARPPGALACAR